MKVTEIAFVGYPVSNLARSREFYEKILGLTPTTIFEGDGKGWIEYEIGANTLAITTCSEDWKPSPTGAGVALEVEDFEETIAYLKEKGVKITLGPFESPVCWMAIIEDPDGSKISIHHRKGS